MTRHRFRRRTSRRGIVLFEAIAALAVIGIAFTAIIRTLIECDLAERRAEANDARFERADDFMHRVALWTRADLDRRLGERRQGEWRLAITRTTPALYEIALVDADTREPLLQSVLYRPDDSNVSP